ncbi:MAG: phosphonate ABC transporter ATP-binding protein [Alphaproteobacteria bacterium]
MLKISNLSKNFGKVTALANVTLDFDEPAMVGIIGRSGAGKSTLLRTINRLSDASSGEILFNGQNVLSFRGKQKRDWHKDCAMIFQQFNLVPRLDVLTNVILGNLNHQSELRSLLKFFTKEERLRALELLERFGMDQTALQRAETLSGGQQQRVAICRAMMQEPKLLLADEPIASLDPLNAKLVMESLYSIQRNDGLMVMCNLHTLDTARTYCDRIIGMRLGQVVFDGIPSDLSDDLAREIYGVEADDAFTPTVTSTALEKLTPELTMAS